MRFVFVDRLVSTDPHRHIHTVKNVSATEDVFDDHFPGWPIFPGALLIETFEQSTQLLIALSHDFRTVGRLDELTRAAFRRPVRPGDRLDVVCDVRAREAARWTVSANGRVDGDTVASATLVFTLEPTESSADRRAHAVCLRDAVRVLTARPLDLAVYGDPS